MRIEKLEQIIHIISRGDTQAAGLLFNKPGGRKYFETIMLVVINNSPYSLEEKEHLFEACIKGLDKIENRIKRQKEGERILRKIYA